MGASRSNFTWSTALARSSASSAADYPDFTGTLFDSAVPLLNSGETLQLKNAGGDVVDEVTYSPAQGADGDTSSLQKNGDVWAPATPTPGSGQVVQN